LRTERRRLSVCACVLHCMWRHSTKRDGHQRRCGLYIHSNTGLQLT